MGRRRAHRHPEPGSGAVRQRARESRVRRRLRGRNRRHADRKPVLVRWLPGLDLPDGRPRRHPHRRRAGLDADHPAHDREDAPAAGDVHRRRVGGALRLLPAADHGQDPLQAADGLPGAGHRQGSRPVLPALRPHDDDLGRGQVLPWSRARTSRTRSSARGTAVPARTETRAIVAAACALGLLAAGIALAQAPRWPMPTTSSGHGKPTLPASRSSRCQPVPAPPRVNLPSTAAPTDIEALARAGARPAARPHRPRREPASHLHHAGDAPREPATVDRSGQRAAARSWCCGA